MRDTTESYLPPSDHGPENSIYQQTMLFALPLPMGQGSVENRSFGVKQGGLS